MAGISYNGPIKINADGTFTPPWGGKFWLHKITGKVDRQNANRTNYSSYEYTSHETHYVGDTSISLPVTRIGSTTTHHSSFNIVDNNGKSHFFQIHSIIVEMEDGDNITVIKSGPEGIRETTDTLKPEFEKQLKFIYNHTTDKEWTYNHSRLTTVIIILLTLSTVILGFGTIVFFLISFLSSSTGNNLTSQYLIMFIATLVVTIIYRKKENNKRNIMSQFLRWYSLAEYNLDKQ